MFSGVYWNQPVCPSVCPSVRVLFCVSVCVQNTTFCQSAGGGIKSFSDSSSLILNHKPDFMIVVDIPFIYFPSLTQFVAKREWLHLHFKG